ncbi:hypothetical protein [Legionella spiritensis]|uniref:hypothetical protein n=1 Tax=Legionella spiritensis TaxID=452 RepID=UPI000F6D5A63|nr:hypothetical protein [Legionella spiritensis]VEG91155.1 Uncharacterised protein [Legionella spiritensis]
MPSLLVNYGGPEKTISSQEALFPKILQACEKQYHSAIQSVAFTAKGLDLTYYQVGIHRMILVELPAQVEQNVKSADEAIKNQALATKKLFRTVKIEASTFNTRDYKLLDNNCVTAVANVLNTVDSNILQGKKKIVPTSLDSDVKNATLLAAMVDEGLRGTALPLQPDEQHKNYKQAHVAPEIWQEVMMPVGNKKQQRHMKQQLRDITNTAIPKPDTNSANSLKPQ